MDTTQKVVFRTQLQKGLQIVGEILANKRWCKILASNDNFAYEKGLRVIAKHYKGTIGSLGGGMERVSIFLDGYFLTISDLGIGLYCNSSSEEEVFYIPMENEWNGSV